MSQFSGKCDFYCHLECFGLEHVLKSKIYVGSSETPLEIKEYKDLIPYFPYIIGSMVSDKNGATIRLSKESFVAKSERESLEYMLQDVLRYYNRCKRKKIDFSVDEAVKKVCYSSWRENVYRELAERVKQYGKKATIDGLYLDIFEHYRKQLVEEMLKYELNPADYGYSRFV